MISQSSENRISSAFSLRSRQYLYYHCFITTVLRSESMSQVVAVAMISETWLLVPCRAPIYITWFTSRVHCEV